MGVKEMTSPINVDYIMTNSLVLLKILRDNENSQMQQTAQSEQPNQDKKA